MRRPRVLIIDDSAFARTVLSRVMRSSGKIDVVDTACDGSDGLERIAALDPDVVTLDLTMPGTGGLAVLRALAGRLRPRVIIVSISKIETELGAEALALGAIDLISKPIEPKVDRLHEIGEDLIARVLAAAAGYLVQPSLPSAALRVTSAPGAPVKLIMIGTSTGGPAALTRVMAGLPATLAAPIAIVLHIPAGYTEALARRLDKCSALHIVEAEDGLVLRAGQAMLARGGMHLHIERDGDGLRARLASKPLLSFSPSVDELFTTGAAAVGAGALGVVMTGMGDDGCAGARVIAAAGGSLLTESPSSCVVYGMPRSVDEAELGAFSVPLENMAEEIIKRVRA